MRTDFAAFILTHGRPGNVLTYDTLRRQGYTGRIVIVIDNEDAQGDAYRERFKDEAGVEVYEFDKAAIGETFDTGDNQTDRRTIVYARNACWPIARELGLRYFLQLDDDYYQFVWRFTDADVWASAAHWKGGRTGFFPADLDRLFTAFLDFLISTPTKTIAMAQGGDFIGGPAGAFGKVLKLRRKAMNSFFCDVERPVGFQGRINEDVNTYTHRATVGDLLFTYNRIALNQTQTQQATGGMSDVYGSLGTYVKSFYTVMFHPSGAAVRMLRGRSHSRLHHSVDWKLTAPLILSEAQRKPRAG